MAIRSVQTLLLYRPSIATGALVRKARWFPATAQEGFGRDGLLKKKTQSEGAAWKTYVNWDGFRCFDGGLNQAVYIYITRIQWDVMRIYYADIAHGDNGFILMRYPMLSVSPSSHDVFLGVPQQLDGLQCLQWKILSKCMMWGYPLVI